MDREIEVSLIKGVEGNSISLNNYRICGSKPWGGGQVLKTWTTSIKDIQSALEGIAIVKEV